MQSLYSSLRNSFQTIRENQMPAAYGIPDRPVFRSQLGSNERQAHSALVRREHVVSRAFSSELHRGCAGARFRKMKSVVVCSASQSDIAESFNCTLRFTLRKRSPRYTVQLLRLRANVEAI